MESFEIPVSLLIQEDSSLTEKGHEDSFVAALSAKVCNISNQTNKLQRAEWVDSVEDQLSHKQLT